MMPARSSNILTLMYVLLLATGCSVTQPVRVLKEGTTRITASLGGPLIPFKESTIPVPYFNIGLMRGYTPDMTTTANIHVLMALLGNIGLDAGASFRVLQQGGWQPEVTVKGQLNLFSDLQSLSNARAFPLVSANGSYLVGGSTLLYFGTDHLLQFSEPVYFVSPFARTQFSVSEHLALQLEVKWMAANVITAHGVFEGHSSIGTRGALGTFVGVVYSW